MQIHAILLRADTPTVNGRIYPKAVMEKAIADYKGKEVFLTLGSNPSTSVLLANVAGVGTIETIDGDWYFDGRVLDTPCGRALMMMDKAEAAVYSVSGIGTVEKDKTVSEFKLISAIVTARPVEE
jgi:hypothetical protein